RVAGVRPTGAARWWRSSRASWWRSSSKARRAVGPPSCPIESNLIERSSNVPKENFMTFLAGKVAFVTGGNRGIGRGIVEALHREGARVYLTSREADAAANAAKEVGERATGLALDVRNYDAVRDAFARVQRDAGGLDVLANNACVGICAPAA